MNRMYEEYYRMDRMPTIWCPGCGNGIVLNGFIEAFKNSGLDRKNTVIVSGIGCSSRSALYLDFDTIHTTHGRAISFATGIKQSRPELNVVVLTGDGDCSAIGGNHLIHAARRNIDLTVVCYNNSTYGMTNGQYSPTTPTGSITATSMYGFMESPFDLCKLVEAAGATYVARTTTFHAKMIPMMIKNALLKKGFSFVDCIAQCPTYFGRKNKMSTPADMMKWIRDSSVNKKTAETMSESELAGKFVIGEFVNKEKPELTAEYTKLVERLKLKEKEGAAYAKV
jgi:2-oxoglutarate ferredoxin oxidoreductase subunit beta